MHANKMMFFSMLFGTLSARGLFVAQKEKGLVYRRTYYVPFNTLLFSCFCACKPAYAVQSKTGEGSDTAISWVSFEELWGMVFSLCVY